MAAVQSSTAGSGAEIFAALGLGKKETAAGKGGIGEAQNQFMTLLITQIRNQDPLSPMQNAEFTSQLAQINTVQGIEKLNATLASLLDNYDSGQAMQAAAMIGKNVLVDGNSMELTAAGSIGGFELQAAAEKVKVTVKDVNGLVMNTLDLGAATAGPSTFYWDGKTESGEAAVAGQYSFTVEAVKGNDPVGSSALQVGIVNAVTRQGSGFKLDLGLLGDYSFDDVKQIL
jgi:flagellar basal-body rod modification protein FlgD